MSALGGKLAVRWTWHLGPLLAEAVEKVPTIKILETMSQKMGRN